jgi:hypothetical protein
MCSTKKRRQSSFTGNARKEGERTLINIPWPAKKSKLKGQKA